MILANIQTSDGGHVTSHPTGVRMRDELVIWALSEVRRNKAAAVLVVDFPKKGKIPVALDAPPASDNWDACDAWLEALSARLRVL
jgi:hypothetical protein